MGNTDARYNSEVFRKDHPMILASRRDLASLKPIKLQYNASGYVAGQVLARQTVHGMYVKYVDGQANGVGTAAAILLFDVPAADFAGSATSDFQVERAVFGGEVNKDLLTGYDAAALTDLGARLIVTALGTTILKF